MNPSANIGRELEAFLDGTPDEDLIQLWESQARAAYEGGVTVSEYMAAIGHTEEDTDDDRV